MHLGNNVRAAVLYSLHFLDQWLFKGHICHTEAKHPMGKCLAARFTHSLSFVFFFLSHTINPSERHVHSKGVTLNSEDLRGSHTQPWGGNLQPRVSWLPRLEASHMICFSHQRERDCPQPLICFSHDLDHWGFSLCLSHGHKEI